jgi:hypothetical protein
MGEIKSRVVSHNDGVRDFKAEVEEVTRNIALEKQAEQEMLESEYWVRFRCGATILGHCQMSDNR